MRTSRAISHSNDTNGIDDRIVAGKKTMPRTSVRIDRSAATRRPPGRAISHHTWSDLLFVHWRVPSYEIEPMLPPELTVDTFDGNAWVGLVACHLSGVRPWWFLPVPGLSSFHETTVRTYVHLDGKDPGIWCLSLDASSSLVVRVARWKRHLPYYRAAMQRSRSGRTLRYASERLWPGIVGPGGSIEAEVGDLIGALDKNLPAGQAVPDTLEHFLAERYILYSQTAGGQLSQQRAHHAPYPLREARLLEMSESLLKAAHIKPRSAPEHVMYSEGVDVEVFRRRPLG